MVHWTEKERQQLHDLWGKLKGDEIGAHALCRLLIVYPWTQGYFESFGNISTPAAIRGNPRVHSHGKVVIGGLDKGLKHLDNVKAAYASLSVLHSEKLHVDPKNFELLFNCITIEVAEALGRGGFCPEVHATWQKFADVCVDALRKQYH